MKNNQPELISAKMHAASHRALRLTTAIVAVGLLGLSSATAYAVSNLTTPTGGTVVGGAATITTPTAGQMNINQTTTNAIINWNNFDVGQGATVQIAQPSAGSMLVNRVTGGEDPAQIMGTIKANGTVVILDKNGVFFGQDSVVNANNLIASTGDVDNKHAMNLKTTLRITNVVSKSTIENDGHITVADAGLVALVAPTIINNGTITARYGRVGLGAGANVSVDLYGDGLISMDAGPGLTHALVRNSGTISAEGGKVLISTDVAAGVVKNVVNNKGVIDVSSVTVNNGTIRLTGGATLTNTGKMVTAPAAPPAPPVTTASNPPSTPPSNPPSTLTGDESSANPPSTPATPPAPVTTASNDPPAPPSTPSQPTTPTTTPTSGSTTTSTTSSSTGTTGSSGSTTSTGSTTTPPAQTASTETTDINLKDWYLTLPVDDKGSTKGTAAEVHSGLATYQSPYFQVGANGSLTFTATTAGAKTKGTKYPRSELRETTSTGSLEDWNLQTGGTMSATLVVDKAPTDADGTVGKEVIGQIHGASNELVRLYWDNGTVYFHNDQAGAGNKEVQFSLTDASGKTPQIALGQQFSYEIHAQGSNLVVSVFSGGDTYTSTTTINSVWQTDNLYFKAGVYLGENASQGASGVGETTFYGLDFSHTAGGGLDGLLNTSLTSLGM